MIIYSENSKFDPSLLVRTTKVQKEYDKALKEISNLLLTPAEFIINNIFEDKHQQILLAKNEYPYDLSKLTTIKKDLISTGVILRDQDEYQQYFFSDAKHWLMWSKNQLFPNAIMDFLCLTFGQINIYAIWENDKDRKSVQDLWHYHFIIKN